MTHKYKLPFKVFYKTADMLKRNPETSKNTEFEKFVERFSKEISKVIDLENIDTIEDEDENEQYVIAFEKQTSFSVNAYPQRGTVSVFIGPWIDKDEKFGKYSQKF